MVPHFLLLFLKNGKILTYKGIMLKALLKTSTLHNKLASFF